MQCLGAVLLCAVVGMLGFSASAFAESVTFKSTGKEQEFKVPAEVTTVHVVAIGGEGGIGYSFNGRGGAGGLGAVVSGDLGVKAGESLYVEVGGNGGPGKEAPGVAPRAFNGGGPSESGDGGGGASDVREVSIGAEPSPGNEASLKSRLLVAAAAAAAAKGGPAPPPQQVVAGVTPKKKDTPAPRATSSRAKNPVAAEERERPKKGAPQAADSHTLAKKARSARAAATRCLSGAEAGVASTVVVVVAPTPAVPVAAEAAARTRSRQAARPPHSPKPGKNRR